MTNFRQLRLPIGRLSDTPYVVVDTETTGLDPDIDRVVEVAAFRFESGRVTDRFESLIDPGRDIPAEASEQHHLLYEDVEGSPPLEAIEEQLADFVGVDPVVAHNARFDRSFLPSLEGKTWICSQRAARHQWPHANKYRNQYLRYWLKLDGPGIRAAAAHRAGGDAIVTGHIFHLELKAYETAHPDAGMDDFMRHVESPVVVTRLPFGKHRGQLIGEVPVSYLQWAIRNVTNLDPDLRFAIENQIDRHFGIEDAA